MQTYIPREEDKAMVSTANSTIGTTSLVEQLILNLVNDIYDNEVTNPDSGEDVELKTNDGSSSEIPESAKHCPWHELIDKGPSTLLPSKYHTINRDDVV